MEYYIYIHYNKITNEPFYVGKGKDDRAWKKTSRNIYWKNIVKKYGYYIEILEKDLFEEDAYVKEKELILFYGRRDLGTGCLVNMTDGGDGHTGWVMTDEIREKYRKASTGRKHTEETKENLRQKNLGRKKSPESIEKTRLKNIGKKQTEESNKKRSETLKGRVFSEETKKLISESKKGGRHTEESKRKMSESSRKNILIKCKETEQIFNGYQEAEDWLKSISLNPYKGCVYKVCKNSIKKTRGYSFEIVNENLTLS